MGDYAPQGLFWISLALINAGLAEQKNRSRLAWFLLSLVLGPFATFYIVATAAVTATPATPATPATQAPAQAPTPTPTPDHQVVADAEGTSGPVRKSN